MSEKGTATQSRAISESVQKLAGTFNKDFVEIIVCEVTSIEDAETLFTIDCTAVSGNADTEIPGVKLNAETNDGYTKVPKVGSTVVVVSSDRNDYYVFMTSDIEKIICVIDDNNSYVFDSNGFVWNEGTLGGMAKTPTLKTKYNNLETKVNAIIMAITTTWVPVANDGGAALKALFASLSATTLAPLTQTTQAEIEDTKIKH